MKPFVTPDTLKFTNHNLPITKSLHFKPSILAFFVASPQKNIDGKNFRTHGFIGPECSKSVESIALLARGWNVAVVSVYCVYLPHT